MRFQKNEPAIAGSSIKARSGEKSEQSPFDYKDITEWKRCQCKFSFFIRIFFPFEVPKLNLKMLEKKYQRLTNFQ